MKKWFNIQYFFHCRSKHYETNSLHSTHQGFCNNITSTTRGTIDTSMWQKNQKKLLLSYINKCGHQFCLEYLTFIYFLSSLLSLMNVDVPMNRKCVTIIASSRFVFTLKIFTLILYDVDKVSFWQCWFWEFSYLEFNFGWKILTIWKVTTSSK